MQKLIYSLVLAALAAVLFAPLRGAELVWDDHSALVGVGDAGTGAEVPLAHIWSLVPGHLYEPLTPTVWRGVAQLAQRNQVPVSRAMHTLSIATHVAATVLVFLVLSQLLASDVAAFVGALLFGVHPLHVEAVAHVAAYKFVLGGTLSLMAINLYLTFAQKRDNRGRARPLSRFYLATLCYLLAVLACQAMVVTPLIARLLEKLLPKKTSMIAARTPSWALSSWLLLAVTPAFWLVSGRGTLGTVSVPFWARPVLAADGASFYLAKFFVPIMTGPDYGRSPSFLLSHWWGFLTWILPATFALALVYTRGKSRTWMTAAFLVTLAALLPYLGFFSFPGEQTSTVADRYAYLGILGLSVAAAYATAIPRRTWLPLTVAAATFFAAYLARRDMGFWQDETALWSHALQINPTSPIANATLGDDFRQKGDWEKAREHYSRALETNALTPDIHFYLGEIERQHGAPDKATEEYRKTLELDPNFAAAYDRLGQQELAAKQDDAALSHFQKAVELAPDNAQALHSLGLLLVRKGAYQDALPYLLKGLRLIEAQPANREELADFHALLGRAYALTNQPDVAQGHLAKTLELSPDQVEANQMLAAIDFARGRTDLARPRYEKALAHGLQDFEAERNLGLILAKSNLHSQAIGHFARALQFRPKDVDVLVASGISYFKLRQLKEATHAFEAALEIRPELADPHYYLGDISRWQGKEPEALAEYYRALKVDPGHAEANYRIGNYLMKEHKVSQARRYYQAALKTQPDDSRLKYSLKKAEQAQSGGDKTTF